MFGAFGYRFARSAFLSVAVALCWCNAVLALEPAVIGERALLAKYPVIKARLEKNQFGAPIYLESAETAGTVRVDMFGTFNYSFPAVRDALQSPVNWCDIAPMHINIKGCTAKKTADQWLLTLYSGRKYYQPTADAYPFQFKFRIVSARPEYLDVALSADDGPLRTRDHRIRLEAVPLDKGTTLLHFSYTYGNGQIARLAIKTYFATIARDKVGFSIVPGSEGQPVYISGVRGAIERNAVRYYLALETFIDTLGYAEGQRFEQRLNRWYDLTARYPRQLKEMGKAEYLVDKRREHANQLAQQK